MVERLIERDGEVKRIQRLGEGVESLSDGEMLSERRG